MKAFYLIAIESSCDDTAVAIIDGQGKIYADLVYSQIEEHLLFGGVVPEIASRKHMEKVALLTKQALLHAALKPSDINVVAATCGPGLIGSLLVGAQFAKGFAQGLGVPFIPVHHIEGHVMSGANQPDFPHNSFIALIVSGGHTALYRVDDKDNVKMIGETRDDAAGEAFDKVGRLLGLSYPAGKRIDEMAQKGDPLRFQLPVAMKMRSTLDFSFSGLKTAARLLIEKLKAEEKLDEQARYDVCAALQKAIVEALLAKAFLACKREKISHLVLGGGVVANSALRQRFAEKAHQEDIQIFIPAKNYCTDNAVMIALAALKHIDTALPVSQSYVPVSASLALGFRKTL